MRVWSDFFFPAWLNTCLNWKLYNPVEKRLWHSLILNYVQNGYNQDPFNTAILVLALCECSLLIFKNCCLWIVKYWSQIFFFFVFAAPTDNFGWYNWRTGLADRDHILTLVYMQPVSRWAFSLPEPCLREISGKKRIGRGGWEERRRGKCRTGTLTDTSTTQEAGTEGCV